MERQQNPRKDELAMNALTYWKLTKNPFAPDSTLFFAGGSIEEASARNEFLVQSRRSMGLLVGPVGAGKTAFLKRCCKLPIQVDGCRRVQSLYCSAWGLSGKDFVTNLAASLIEGRQTQIVRRSIESSGANPWTMLNDLFVAYRAMETHLVWYVDDVSETPSLAESLRRVVELDGPLTILISASAEQTATLPSQLTNLNELRIELPAWDLGLTADYFDFALEHASGNPNIFEAQSITRIHELSDGLPSRIKRIADLALYAGAARRLPRISTEIVEDIFEEMSPIGNSTPRERMSLERV